MMSATASAMLISASSDRACGGGKFALVERVAEEVADLLLKHSSRHGCVLKSANLAPVARAANVGVIIERGLNLKQNFSGHTC